MTKVVLASCHCGAVQIEGTLRDDAEEPSRCTCSFCRRRQAGNISVATSSVKVIKGQDALREYQFGTRTARHFFCGVCGIYTHHQRRSDPAETGINYGCIEGAQPWTHEPMHWNDGINHPTDEKGGS